MTEEDEHPSASRYRVSLAPGGLRLVQDLLNTAAKDSGHMPDLLDAADTAAEWLTEHGATVSGGGLSTLRTIRDALRRALVARDHTDGDVSGAAGQPGASSVEMPSSLHLDGEGNVRLVPTGAGADGVAQQVLGAVHAAQLTGAWRRLKVCRNPECSVAFWDGSRNTSGVWHDVHTCGNVMNLRKSRARRAANGS